MKPLSIETAKLAVERFAAENDITVVYPGDLRRTAVIYAMAAVHAITGSGWSLEHALESVSVTLPGTGNAAALLAQIPVVGQILAFIASDLAKPTIFLSPAAMSSGAALMTVFIHELGHVGQIRRGGFLWCIAYGIVPEVRAAAEAPCYGADVAVAYALTGEDIDVLRAQAMDSLSGYGLGPDEMKAAKAVILSSAGDPGGVVKETMEMLAAVGWTP